MARRILVIGGANTDIIGLPDSSLLPHDSNPGHVRMGHGGVGRNIAENLARLGVDVNLVTAVGDDASGLALIEACEAAGISTSGSLVVPGASSSSYLAIMDAEHDLEVAINDMRVLEHLTPQYLDRVATKLGDPALVVFDTNLPQVTLEHGSTLWPGARKLLDPVSAPKAVKAAGILGRLDVLKANELEASVLAGVSMHTQEGLNRGIDVLLDAGIREVFISMGERGVYCADSTDRFAVSAPHVAIANTTGAGDAFAAGIAYATLEGMGLRDAAEFASAVAGITLVTERTVSQALTAEAAHLQAGRRAQ
ncbi:MAG: carbohydrate kinase family protein [Coriobacteriia bacterium]|nr:carbohydrate kinase family protein [Coriobacteriia bacterium]MBN2822865.1 carbohydrate kinase family protein [Coriobacteriia bacterium]